MSANSSTNGLKRWVLVLLAFKLDHLKPVEELLNNLPTFDFHILECKYIHKCSEELGFSAVPLAFQLHHLKLVHQMLQNFEI